MIPYLSLTTTKKASRKGGNRRLNERRWWGRGPACLERAGQSQAEQGRGGERGGRDQARRHGQGNGTRLHERGGCSVGGCALDFAADLNLHDRDSNTMAPSLITEWPPEALMPTLKLAALFGTSLASF